MTSHGPTGKGAAGASHLSTAPAPGVEETPSASEEKDPPTFPRHQFGASKVNLDVCAGRPSEGLSSGEEDICRYFLLEGDSVSGRVLAMGAFLPARHGWEYIILTENKR